ncbi:mannitol dehydrogenase family protein [Trebonia kvetii]|uniref:Mannitol-1-phosphate 5-dehydrogenase n=1 Tax=Trebonia kvetii TaxID=2480626 RepID=A0A6P2C6F9_9ACTN|nr:mannitol dehydrogenase family protein [Trebonia kvetii]TVZ05103.1 mannitol dehydrogenase family protein [Trebonia kvetii]
MTSLTEEALPLLTAGVSLPRYDRGAVTTGIVHIGVGNFHRSHQAMYLDTLMNDGAALDWGICGIGLQPSNAAMRDALAAQDGLYTLVIRHGDGSWDARVIGSVVEYLFAPDDPQAAIEKLADPATRIVSLTVTEGGYYLDAVTGEFNAADQAIQADLAPGAVPRTLFGLVTEALARRRARGVPAFTVLSCDNIQGNGHISARTFTAFARLRDPELADWIAGHVRFPNCMVDRITPKTTDEDRAELSRRFGIDDQWPVLCEPFTQWVLEDDFADGRPPLQDAGVQIVPDVEPYELMKLRLLNASHHALCYPGHLTGLRFVHEVTTDPLFAGFLLDYMTGEAIPTLRPVPGVDLAGYAHQLIERFSNPEVRDTVARLCANASDCIPKFLLPVIREQLAAGRPVTRSAAVVATWARYAEGTDENGEPHELDDDLAPQLRAAARRQREQPTAFLDGNRAVFGELADEPRFTRVYTAILGSLIERGVRETYADLDRFADRPVFGGPVLERSEQ